MEGLIARLEAATGPDRELDEAIVKALYPEAIVNLYCVDDDEPIVFPAEPLVRNKRDLPRFTASIDAALMLVPEGHDVHVNLYFGRNGEGAAVVSKLKQINLPRTFAPTPALALCIAALKAR